MPRTFSDPFQIDDIQFNTDVPDSDGVEWLCDTLEGWEDTTKPNIETVQFGYSDGVAMGERSPLSARYIEFSGVAVAPDRAAAQRAFRRLQGALDPNTYFTAIRQGPIPESMITRLADKVYKTQDIGHAFRFATTLIAPWPFKQGLTAKTGSAGPFTGGDYVRVYPRVYPLIYSPSIDDPTTAGTITATNTHTNPNVGVDLTGWASNAGAGGVTGTITRQAVTRRDGTAGFAGRTTWTTGTSSVGGGLDSDTGAGAIPSPSTTRFAYIEVFSSVTQRLSLIVQHRTDAGAAVGSNVTVVTAVVTANTWTVLSGTFTSPDTATRALLSVRASAGTSAVNWPNGSFLQASRSMLSETTHAFLDGATPSPDNGTTQYAWTANPEQSASREVVLSTTSVPAGPTTIEILNEGNADAWPIIRVRGPLPASAWYLVNDATGEQQSFTLAIGSDQTLEIDERRQVATLEGQVVDYYLRGDWLNLPPNVVSTLRLVTTENYPGAGIEVTAYDTWK